MSSSVQPGTSPLSLIPEMKDRAAETIHRVVQNMSRDKHTATSLTQVVELVRDLAGKAHKIQVDELAEVIGRDLATTERVIRAANNIGNNPMGTPVKTLSHAILVIGFSQIKSLSLSLLLLDNAEGTKKSEECREISSVALAGGILAKGIMMQFGNQDPEEAFVCASLRNYGQLLMASFLPEEYKEAKHQAELMPACFAFRKVFGLSPSELGYAILSKAQLPKNVITSLLELPSDRTSYDPNNSEDELVFISEFSNQLCELVATHKGGTDDLKSKVRNLTSRYGHLPIDWKQIQSLLEGVDNYLTTIRKIHGAGSFSSPLFAKIKALVLYQGIAQEEKPPEESEWETTQKASIRMESSLQQLESLMEEETVNLHKIYHTGTKALHLGLALEHCVLFSRNKGERHFHARVGTGLVFDGFQNLPPVDPDPEEIFGIAISKGEDLLIENASIDPETLRSFPKWMRTEVLEKSVVLLLIREAERISGIFFGIGGSSTLPLAKEKATTIRSITRHIAFARRMGGSDDPTTSIAIKLELD